MSWQTLPEEDLLRIARNTADRCVEVVNLPPEVRRATTAKGGASPEQAGWLSALLCTQALTELDRRAACPPSS